MITVNEMIIEAITTDSRKRKARYQTELEALGYKVLKDRSWTIKNLDTGRYIHLKYNDNVVYTNYGGIRFGHIWSRKNGYVKKPISVINFYKLLNTPLNSDREWHDNRTNVAKLRQSLHDRKYHSKEYNNAMAEYQQRIDNITAEYKRMLDNAKRNFEWNVKYHSEAVKTANKEIEKLLHKTA